VSHTVVMNTCIYDGLGRGVCVCLSVCLSVCPDNTLKTIADISYVDRRKMAEDFARQDHKSK